MEVDDGSIFFEEVETDVSVKFARVLSVDQVNLVNEVAVVIGCKVANDTPG